ncbi:uncharacterized protein LOC144132746 isoform X5 [Amblyomma americanum]
MSDEERDVDVESDADKRAHHNALERRRRDHIKFSFTSLRDAVPSLQGEKRKHGGPSLNMCLWNRVHLCVLCHCSNEKTVLNVVRKDAAPSFGPTGRSSLF